MSECPKCKKKLRLLDVGQYCPHCGANMRFYGFADRFYRDAKRAELSVARIHVKLRRFKTAYVGGKLPIARLCTALLPLLSLLLPVMKIQLTLPFFKQDISLSAVGLYSTFTDGTFGYISGMTASAVAGDGFAMLKNTILVFLPAAVCAVLIFFLTLFCFISIRKVAAVLFALGLTGFASSVVSAVMSGLFCKTAETLKGGMLAGSLSFGFIVSIAAFTTITVINFLIAKNGLKVVYEEGDLERVEIGKKVKKGELNIDDLPQPIVETAETRAIDEEILKEQRKFAEKEEAADEKV